MKNAKILIARYKAGKMTKQQILDYISIKYQSKYDKEIVDYIKKNL